MEGKLERSRPPGKPSVGTDDLDGAVLVSERATHLQSRGKGFRIFEIALVPRPDVEVSRFLCLVDGEVDRSKE